MKQPAPATAPFRGATSPAFVLLSFEGPDAYSHAGGLAARVSGLACALAEEGYETHLFYIGAPELPAYEVGCGGRLHLHRWCQWISRYHPAGVYDGEEGKLNDWNRSLPAWLAEHLLPGLIGAGRPVVVIGEEWHTAWSIISLSRRARESGWSERVRFFWNANNTFGFERVPWRELDETATITTVSRFMKHHMWGFGVDPHVIPNGIAPQWLAPHDRKAVAALKRSVGQRLLLVKVARWDPDKRWLMAMDAVGALKARGLRPLLIARGGIEAHGSEVAARARAAGLEATSIACEGDSGAAVRHRTRAERAFAASATVPLPRERWRAHEQRDRAVRARRAGSDGEWRAELPWRNRRGLCHPRGRCISLQSRRPGELVSQLLYLREHRERAMRLRREARRSAARFTWQKVIRTHIAPRLSSSRLV